MYLLVTWQAVKSPNEMEVSSWENPRNVGILQHATFDRRVSCLAIGSQVQSAHWVSHHVLVGGLEHSLFSIIYGIIIPTDFHIFQRGGSTTNQCWISPKWSEYCRILLASFGISSELFSDSGRIGNANMARDWILPRKTGIPEKPGIWNLDWPKSGEK
jgi:hypothetical protein